MPKVEYNYTNRIKAYLHLLGGFDEVKIKAIEDELLELLQANEFSPYRYRRYKTDRDNSTPIYHQELEFLFSFFFKKFEEQIAIEKDVVVKETLSKWMPKKSNDLFLRGAVSAAS